MSKPVDSRVAKARFVADLQARRDAQLAAERQAAPQATDADREARLSDAFRAAFQPRAAAYHPRQDRPAESPWDSALRLGAADDDAPRPPQADAEPVAAPAPVAPPVSVEPSPMARRASAEDLFSDLERRLQATPEAVEVPPAVLLRRLYRELPASQREAIAKVVESTDYGLEGYFAGRAFSDDYRAVLVGSALSRRLQDAQRLDPSLTPDRLLQQMLGTAT